MSTDKKIARIVGLLFIIGTVAGVLSVIVTGSILADLDFLAEAAAHEDRVVLGAILVLIMGLALSMVPVVMFPIFRKTNEILALGAVVFRGALETVAYLAIAAGWLLLLTLSRDYTQASAPDVARFETVGAVLLDALARGGQMLSIVFSLGALMFYALFFQSRLIPRWLSVWGLVGAALYLAAPVLDMFGHELGILMAPLAVQEMVMAVWLIVRGFDPGAQAAFEQAHPRTP